MQFKLKMGLTIYLLAISAIASAQSYPNKPVQLVVPAGAGGSADLLARLIGEKLNTPLGQRVVVENRSGAGQMIGAEYVAKSTADGHTIILTTATYTTSSAIRTKLPFDPIEDLTGITMVGKGPFMLVVHPSLPVKSLKDLIALAKAKPKQLLYASAGSGSISHLATAVFASNANIEILHVPYKSLPPAVTDTIGGHVQALTGSLPPLLPHVRANRLRALAVTSAKRSRFVPELPTVSESGVPDYEVQQWWGMFAPAATPKEIVARLNNEVHKVLVDDEVKRRLDSLGADPLPTSPDEFSKFVKEEILKWKKVIKTLQIKAG